MNDVQEIQLQIDTAKKIVKNSDALNRLYKNRDFLHLFEQVLFQDEPIRLTHLLSDPAHQSEAARAKIIKEMDVIAGLVSWLRTVDQVGADVRVKLAGYEAEQELARQELAE